MRFRCLEADSGLGKVKLHVSVRRVTEDTTNVNCKPWVQVNLKLNLRHQEHVMQSTLTHSLNVVLILAQAQIINNVQPAHWVQSAVINSKYPAGVPSYTKLVPCDNRYQNCIISKCQTTNKDCDSIKLNTALGHKKSISS